MTLIYAGLLAIAGSILFVGTIHANSGSKPAELGGLLSFLLYAWGLIVGIIGLRERRTKPRGSSQER